jgi:phosphoglycerol geranylgeranyltransferase
LLHHDKGIYTGLLHAKVQQEKKWAVLLDPDKIPVSKLEPIITLALETGVDYFFIGGSLLVNNQLDALLSQIREQSDIPTVLFPGSSFQLSYRADALLFLSLISGRNPELLIGQHVLAAPFLKISPLEIISTGYMLIDGGIQTSVQYMSNTYPIPAHKNDIAVCTAIAGEMLGLKMLYLEAGSGAQNPVPAEMITAVSQSVSIPIITGGGIRTPEQALLSLQSGADVLVIGNAVEKDPRILHEIGAAVKAAS